MHIQKLLLITFLVVANAKGQTQDTPALKPTVYELPDLIVYGTLWDTHIMDVTKSVTVFTEDALQDRQATHFQDLVNFIPNLTTTGGNNRSRYFQIRGMGENSQFEGETPDLSVRFLIDDFDFTGIGGIASFFDLRQVEIIRGAQSSSYGVNASAGIIKLSTNEADGEKGSKARLSLGSKNQRSLGYATGGILGEETSSKTNYRLSIFQNNTDGFIKNTKLNLSDTNKSSEFFSLLKLKHYLSNDSNILTSFLYADAKGGYDQWSLENKHLETITDDPGKDNQRSKGISLRLNSDNFKNFSLTAVTSILNTDSLYSYDSDWGNSVKYDVNETTSIEKINLDSSNSGFEGFLSTLRDRKSFSQEIRIDSSDSNKGNSLLQKWTSGIHFSKLSESTKADFYDSLEEDDGEVNVQSDYNTQSISLFGNVDYKLSRNSNLMLGLRFESHKVEFISETLNNGKYGWAETDNQMVLEEGGKSSTHDNLLGASISYQNKLTNSYSLNLSYNRGYKGPGANTKSFRLYYYDAPDTFDTEYIDSFDIGLNYVNLENSYRSRFNLFFINRDHAQLRDYDGAGGWFNYYTKNQGDAKHYGAEYHSIWNFIPDWSLENNISYLKAKLDASNRDLANAPSFKYSLSLKYNPKNGFYSNISINGSDEYFEENGHPEKREAFSIVNASVGYTKEQWDICLWAKNLFDHNYSQRIFYFNNYHPLDGGKNATQARLYKAYGDPLNYGITINYNW